MVCTRFRSPTRNRRKAAALSQSYDQLEKRIAALREQEELDRIRPDLDGNEIMRTLGIRPGPVVGKAYQFPSTLRPKRFRPHNGPLHVRSGGVGVPHSREFLAAEAVS